MLYFSVRQPLGRLSFALNAARGLVGVSRLPVFANRTRGFLTTTPDLKEVVTAKAKPKKVVVKKNTTTTTAKAASKSKPKPEKPKQPRILKKDLTPPVKRPIYGFAQFVQERREELALTGNLREMLPEASVQWNALSDEAKQKYKCDKEELQKYFEVKRKWLDGLGFRERKVLGLKAKRPPRPLTAYQMVLKEVFNKNPGLSFKEIVPIVQQHYKSLTPEQKSQYERDARAAFESQPRA